MDKEVLNKLLNHLMELREGALGRETKAYRGESTMATYYGGVCGGLSIAIQAVKIAINQCGRG